MSYPFFVTGFKIKSIPFISCYIPLTFVAKKSFENKSWSDFLSLLRSVFQLYLQSLLLVFQKLLLKESKKT